MPSTADKRWVEFDYLGMCVPTSSFYFWCIFRTINLMYKEYSLRRVALLRGSRNDPSFELSKYVDLSLIRIICNYQYRFINQGHKFYLFILLRTIQRNNLLIFDSNVGIISQSYIIPLAHSSKIPQSFLFVFGKMCSYK